MAPLGEQCWGEVSSGLLSETGAGGPSAGSLSHRGTACAAGITPTVSDAVLTRLGGYGDVIAGRGGAAAADREAHSG